MRPKLPICTSGRCHCNKRCRMPGRDGAETPGGHVPACRQRHRGAHGCLAPAPRPTAIARRQPGPPCPDHHRRRQCDGAGCRARQPLPRRPAPQGGRSRARTSTRVPIAGTQPGRDRAGTGDPDCCAGRDSLAGAVVPESTRQRHSQDGCTGRRLAPALHRPAIVLEEPCAMRRGRLVPAAYRMRRSGSEWSRSRKSLPAHGHES